jgi:hypothetical protein
MISVETILGMGGEGIKRMMEGESSTMKYLVCIKNVNVTMYPHQNNKNKCK